MCKKTLRPHPRYWRRRRGGYTAYLGRSVVSLDVDFKNLKQLSGDWWSNEGHVRLYSLDKLKTFGKGWEEVWWAPGLDQLARIIPALGHTLMLRIDVTADMKNAYTR